MSLSKTIGFISGINECVNLFQWATSALSTLHSRWSGTQQQKLQGELLQLQSSLQRLRDTLPANYDLIDRAEWRIHEHCVANLLPNIKDAVYNADDLLDEFRWYEQKVALESNANQSPFMDFFNNMIQGSFNKVNDIMERLDNISSQLERMGLHETPQRFDKSLRPGTSSFPNERKIFGRDKELKKVMELLSVPINLTRACYKRKRNSSTADASMSTSEKSRISCFSVLPIVGIGGVGKTTLAQHICNHPQVKSHFDLIIWTCVSDDFDATRLIKEAIQSSSGKEATTDNLNCLQLGLSNIVNNKRFLIILDDVWDDALKENGQCWERLCLPLENGLQGSMVLVTTRSSKVADGVSTMDPFTLDGLKDDIFWDFFKLCAFGSQSSNNDPDLEDIGRGILPKLKGSPLAAKTLGRLLRMNLQIPYWNNILLSELWDLKQEETDILPALRLSYMYLPFHLKRCFSFCAVYPKDHKFEKNILAEIWVAEGFVESDGGFPILDIGHRYFEDLVSRSFFQKVRGTYVIHDLMHDMAQLVSKHECFTIKELSDFQKVPRNVCHLMILDSRNFDCSNLLSLCEHTKLRTLLCEKSLISNITLASVMDRWCSELRHIRVFSCVSLKEIPMSIGNLKHLRYLRISKKCPFHCLPPEICWLYKLKFLYAIKCALESLPSDFSKLINLQTYESVGFAYYRMKNLLVVAGNDRNVRLMKNLNQFCGDLDIYPRGFSKDLAIEIDLKNKKDLRRLTLNWLFSSCKNNEIVLQVLQPPTNLKCLEVAGYGGEYLPCWSNNGSISVFPSLTDLAISSCEKLSSLDHFLQADYMPVLERISIRECANVTSLQTERFGEFSCLGDFTVSNCPKLFHNSGSLSVPTLKNLELRNSGILLSNIECSSLTSLSFKCVHMTAIPIQLLSDCQPSMAS
ncbi:putative disease resistance protein RGA1 [Oryza glaberrima]|uniref:putative disease resistance protein RGA1 n=1 Tax=Oryza glaberrima TaxID=4538 RepID=UPI00224C413B|nr:putative disease resistance protein RGA1 [Oryza glaberrima]